MFPSNFQVYSWNPLKEMSNKAYPGTKQPTQNRNPRPNPKILLKTFPDACFGLIWRNSWFVGASQAFELRRFSTPIPSWSNYTALFPLKVVDITNYENSLWRWTLFLIYISLSHNFCLVFLPKLDSPSCHSGDSTGSLLFDDYFSKSDGKFYQDGPS